MANYTKVFTKPYADGYEDLPSQTTPITAETLNDKDDTLEHIEGYLYNNPIAEVVDNLTTNDATKALSAKQGKILNDTKLNVADLPNSDVQTSTTGQFTTVTGGLMQSCVVDLEPIQDLHGYSKPWVGGSGKNKLRLYNKTASGLTFTADELLGKVTLTGTSSVSGWGPGIIAETNLPVGRYVCTATNNPDNAQILTEWAPLGVITSNGVEFDVTSNTQPVKVAWRVDSGTTYNYTIEGLMIRLASVSDATFEPYSNICPISGHTQVQVGNVGKNRINLNDAEIGTAWNGVSNSARARLIIELEVGQTYTFKANGTSTLDMWYGILTDVIPPSSPGELPTNPWTFTANKKYLLLGFNKNNITLSDIEALKLQLEEGSQATDYEPYNGYTHVINLGGEYYGGTLDAVSGVLTVTHGIGDLGTLTYTASTVSDGRMFYTELNPFANIKAILSYTEIPNAFCSNMRVDYFDNINQGRAEGLSIGPDNGRIRIFSNSTYKNMSASDFKTAMSGVQLCYELATPTTIQLTPTQLETLVGTNDVFAPLVGQSVEEVEYREVLAWDDVERAVAVKLDLSSVAPIEYTDKASQSYNQKQLFIKDNKLCQALASISSGASFTENTNFKYTTLAEIIEPLIP